MNNTFRKHCKKNKINKVLAMSLIVWCLIPKAMSNAQELIDIKTTRNIKEDNITNTNDVDIENDVEENNTVEENKNSENADIEIKATELDLGDYQTSMTVGEKQLLYVTVIPTNATNQDLTYESSNTSVATVNGMGRITALQEGKTIIKIACGKIKAKITLIVATKESDEEIIIEVTDIEISDYEDELYVDEVMSLSATIIPEDATTTKMSYLSSDENIATVNSSGEVKGIAPGNVIIYIQSGRIIKEVSLTVKTKTVAISLDADYKVLKVGDYYDIKATVTPNEASSVFTFTSLDKKIATVSNTGAIHAISSGSTAIIISNGDLQASLNVIINEAGENEVGDLPSVHNNNKTTLFLKELSASECQTVTTEMLQFCYEKKEILTIAGEDYIIYIDGKKIANYNNELSTILNFEKNEDGIAFTLNNGKKLCGEIELDVSHIVTNEKYLYIYNTEREKYQRIEVENIIRLFLDTGGTYLLTTKQVSSFSVSILFLILGCVAIIISVFAYVVTKKKYWFW